MIVELLAPYLSSSGLTRGPTDQRARCAMGPRVKPEDDRWRVMLGRASNPDQVHLDHRFAGRGEGAADGGADGFFDDQVVAAGFLGQPADRRLEQVTPAAA